MDPERVDDDFQAFLDTALRNLGRELWQEYLRTSAWQATERRRLAGEVELLQERLRILGSRAVDEPLHAITVVQPPPSSRVALLLTEDAHVTSVRPTIVPAFVSYPTNDTYGHSKSSSESSTAVAHAVVADCNHLWNSSSQKEDPPTADTSPGETESFQQDSPTNQLTRNPFNKRALPRLVFSQDAYLSGNASTGTPRGLGPEAERPEGGLTHGRSFFSSKSGEMAAPTPTCFLRADSQTELSGQVLRRRLQARLRSLKSKGLIRGRDLHQTMCDLRLQKYSVQDMDRLILLVGLAIDLHFGGEGGQAPCTRESPYPSVGPDMEARAEWQWQWPDMDVLMSVRNAPSVRERAFSVLSSNSASSATIETDKYSEQVIPFKALIELFCKDEKYLERCLGPMLTDQVYAMREVLLTGEANRIISDMTFVTIDDLASNRRRNDPTVFLDVLTSCVILLNGIAVGMHTDPKFRRYAVWTWVEAAFTAFFAVEMLVRMYLSTCSIYFFGPDRGWHLFDFVLVVVGALDCATDLARTSSLPSPGAFRLIRLARLYRTVRRFKFMLELRLMVKAVLSGTRTLFWAFVLLIFVLYTFGVASAILLGNAADAAVQELFANVPTAMFTTFRCVTGDCFTTSGASLTAVLYAQYGVLFATVFVIMYMVITLGLFNVILAIYVDVTMVAVKQTDDANKGKHEQEPIRVAQLTKRLLKMFCAAHRAYGKLSHVDRLSVGLHEVIKASETTNVEIDDDIVISREMYMFITEDPEVRKIMDDLDIPPDRAALFDCFDADGSGGLQATELVRGFLKVRGEVKKADHVACILALRSIQTMVKQVKDTVEEHGRVLDLLHEGRDMQLLTQAVG